MKNKLAGFLALSIAFSSVNLVKADTNFSDIKNYILSNDKQKDYSIYDINDDGKVNVFDVIHLKKDILENSEEMYSFLNLGEAEVNRSDDIFSIPLIIEETGLDIYRIEITFQYNPDEFYIYDFDPGDFSGTYKWTYSHDDGYCDFVIDLVDDCSEGGIVIVPLFGINPVIPAEIYEIIISNMKIYYTDEDEDFELESDLDSIIYNIEIPEKDISDNPPGNDDLPALSDNEIYNKMIALKRKYPEGMTWTNDNSYKWNGGLFNTGYGCAGFAFILSDAAFGTLPARMLKGDYSLSDIRVGDILRINNNSHSVIVLIVNDDNVIVAEGNYNRSIHWGRKISFQELSTNLTYIITRYPD